LFAIFIDDLVKLIDTANIGCKTGGNCIVYFYTQMILSCWRHQLGLYSLVDICELELKRLDMAINASKSSCMRFGPRNKSTCANVTVSGLKINWVSSNRYLGVFLESSFNFKSSYSANKASFYQAFNAILGKVGRSTSEEVLFALLKSKCLPILLYGTEACLTNSSVRQSLQFTFNRVLCKIFGAMSSDSFVMVCNFCGLNP